MHIDPSVAQVIDPISLAFVALNLRNTAKICKVEILLISNLIRVFLNIARRTHPDFAKGIYIYTFRIKTVIDL